MRIFPVHISSRIQVRSFPPLLGYFIVFGTTFSVSVRIVTSWGYSLLLLCVSFSDPVQLLSIFHPLHSPCPLETVGSSARSFSLHLSLGPPLHSLQSFGPQFLQPPPQRRPGLLWARKGCSSASTYLLKKKKKIQVISHGDSKRLPLLCNQAASSEPEHRAPFFFF